MELESELDGQLVHIAAVESELCSFKAEVDELEGVNGKIEQRNADLLAQVASGQNEVALLKDVVNETESSKLELERERNSLLVQIAAVELELSSFSLP